MAVTHNGVTYRVADAHAHIYPGKIAEKATANVGRFYDIEMEEVGLPHILSEEGKAAGIDRYLVCSVATKVEQVESINRFIAEKCAKYPAFIGLGAWHQDVADIEGELDRIQALGLRGIKLHPDFQCFNIDDDRMLPVYEACMRRGMVVLFHTGDDRTDFSSPRRLANVLEKLPEFVCIAAHLGGYREWADARAVQRGGRAPQHRALRDRQDALRHGFPDVVAERGAGTLFCARLRRRGKPQDPVRQLCKALLAVRRRGKIAVLYSEKRILSFWSGPAKCAGPFLRSF